MLFIFVVLGAVLMTSAAGPPISGYSLGSLSGGRGQEFNSGSYHSGGFVGIKDSQGELGDQLESGGFASASSNRYSVAAGGGVAGSGQQSSGSGYASDSGYSDSGASLTGSYGTHGTSAANSDGLSLSSSASYTSDIGSHGGSSSDGGGLSYGSAGSSSGLGSYATSLNTAGNQVESGFVGYSDSGHTGSHVGERGSVDYSSSSHPTSSYVSYSVGGPKASAYSIPGPSHGPTHMSGYSPLSSSAMYPGPAHHAPISHRPSPSVYSPDSGHHKMSSGGSYASPALGNLLAGLHGPGHGAGYPVSGGNGHRASGHGHPFSSSSNHSPNFASRGPGYYQRPGNKIILLKESGSGGKATHGYHGEQHSYAGGIFGGANGAGYKIRNVGSSPSYGPGYASSYPASGGYSSAGKGSFFGLL